MLEDWGYGSDDLYEEEEAIPMEVFNEIFVSLGYPEVDDDIYYWLVEFRPDDMYYDYHQEMIANQLMNFYGVDEM
jgi:hypothetical protein